MNNENPKDVAKIERDYKELSKLKGEEKLQRLRSIHSRLKEFEMAAAQDFSIPFYTVRLGKELVGLVQKDLARCEAAAKRAGRT